VIQIGTVVIPAIGLRHPVYQGIWLTVIDHGPGHWPGTALPGEVGNAVFPGHRVTHSHPFRDLDQLHPGDEITMEMRYGTFTYRVRDTIIVRPTDTWVADQHQRAELTLIACHPKHSARQRIVVRADLVGTPIVAPAGSEPEVHA
jgi:sortase A